MKNIDNKYIKLDKPITELSYRDITKATSNMIEADVSKLVSAATLADLYNLEQLKQEISQQLSETDDLVEKYKKEMKKFPASIQLETMNRYAETIENSVKFMKTKCQLEMNGKSCKELINELKLSVKHKDDIRKSAVMKELCNQRRYGNCVTPSLLYSSSAGSDLYNLPVLTHIDLLHMYAWQLEEKCKRVYQNCKTCKESVSRKCD